MADVFISYSSSDLGLAEFIQKHLQTQNLSVFMASVSITPGQNWTKQIWDNLLGSTWVLFLASREACQSSYVQQELGGAMARGKSIIPIVWDLDPSELPGWVNRRQALDLRGISTLEQVSQRIRTLSEWMGQEKGTATLIGALVIAGLIFIAVKN